MGISFPLGQNLINPRVAQSIHSKNILPNRIVINLGTKKRAVARSLFLVSS